MKKWLLFIFIVVIFALQFSVAGVFLKVSVTPNFFVLFCVSLIILFGFEASWGWILLSGLAMDVGAAWLFGSGTLALILISWLVDKTKVATEMRSSKPFFILLLSLFFVAASIFFDILMHFFGLIEKQMGISGVSVIGAQTNADYFMKIIFFVFFGIATYYFARGIKSGSRPEIFRR